ncbi:MAG: type IV pili methyl-accepting chemotaxis transducer N-terminal domain-containing protein [Pseudomonadota bacterium]
MPITITRRAAAAGIAALTVARFPASAGASETAALRRRINVAGRQRMLTQRMVMAAAFARLDIDADAHIAILADANALFSQSLAALRNGDAALGLPASTKPEVIARLDAVDGVWAKLGPVADEIAARAVVTKADIGALAVVEEDARALSDAVVTALETAYGDAASSARLNICGRQRMLTQKMAKEAALMGLSYRRADNKRALGETIELFERSLSALIEGDRSLDVAASPEAAQAHLSAGAARWTDLKPALEDMAERGDADLFDLEIVAEERDLLLAEMNAAVEALETA